MKKNYYISGEWNVCCDVCSTEIKASQAKHVWIDSNRVVVYTGADIPKSPPAQEPLYEESKVVELLKTAGKTEVQAKDMLAAKAVAKAVAK